ncbi:response regulator [Nitrospira sp. Nam74]
MPVISPAETKILNVNDDAATRYLWAHILRQAGYHVREAHSGQTALQTLRTDPPHLVLLDVKLADIDGFSLCQQLKTIDPTVPILMASAWFTSDDDFINGLTTGADGYLYEPANSTKLLAMIKTILRMSTRLQQARTTVNELQRQNQQLGERLKHMELANEGLQEELAESRQFEEAVVGRELKLMECEKDRERLQRELRNLRTPQQRQIAEEQRGP